MSQIILTSLYNKLIAVQTAGTVYALVGGRIFQLEANQGTVMPLLTFAIQSERTETFMESATASKHVLEIAFSFWFKPDSSIVTAMAAEAALFLLLQKTSVTPSDAAYSTIEMVCISRGTPMMTEDAIEVTTNYRLFATKQT